MHRCYRDPLFSTLLIPWMTCGRGRGCPCACLYTTLLLCSFSHRSPSGRCSCACLFATLDWYLISFLSSKALWGGARMRLFLGVPNIGCLCWTRVVRGCGLDSNVVCVLAHLGCWGITHGHIACGGLWWWVGVGTVAWGSMVRDTTHWWGCVDP
jgi:hypothetical protein